MPSEDSANGGRTVQTANGITTVAELHQRCSIAEPGIVVLREIPDGTADAFEIMFQRALELGASFERFVLIVDLAATTVRPTGSYLQTIRRAVRNPAAAHYAVARTPFVFRAAVGFILGRLTSRISLHTDMDGAMATARRILGES